MRFQDAGELGSDGLAVSTEALATRLLCVGVGLGVGVTDGVGEGVGIAVGVAVGVGVGVEVIVGDGVGIGVEDGVGVGVATSVIPRSYVSVCNQPTDFITWNIVTVRTLLGVTKFTEWAVQSVDAFDWPRSR